MQQACVLKECSHKECMGSMERKWRQFKTDLNRKFIVPYLEHPKLLEENSDAFKHLPRAYSSIEQQHWDHFVASRTTPEFLVSS